MLTIERHDATTVHQQAQHDLSGSATPQADHVIRQEQSNLIRPAAPGAASSARSEARAPTPASAASAASQASTPSMANAAPAGKTAPLAPTPTPDERPLWQLLHEHRLADFDRRIHELEHEAPSWKPSPSLVAERTRQQQEADIVAALQSGDASALRRAIAHAPEAFSCAHIDRLWQAADVFARGGHTNDVDALYRTVIPACPSEENRIATLYRAEQQLSGDRADALIALEASEGHRDAQGDAAFAKLRYQRDLGTLAKLPTDSAEAARRLGNLAPSIRAYRDGPAAALAGWIAYGHHDINEAANWFEAALTFSPGNIDAKLGLAQVRIESHDYDAAQSLLDEPIVRDDPRARHARAQIALARANDAYAAHRYEDTLRWLDAAEQEGQQGQQGSPAADTAALRGWTLYAMGRYREAQAAFRVRYDARHDDDSAEGLALSMRATHRNEGTSARAELAAHDRRIDAYLDALDAQQRYYRKQFVASKAALDAALAGPADPSRIHRYVPADMTGIDAPSLTGGLEWSDHVGAAAQGQLTTIAPAVRSDRTHDTTQFTLQYRQWFINSGTASYDQLVPAMLGMLDGQARQGSQGALDAAMHGWMVGGSARAEELQGTVSDSARIGATAPVDWRLTLDGTQGAPSGFALSGLASVAQQTAWGMWTLYGGSMPVRDSLLSWRGMTLPAQAGGDRWGAVRRTSGGAKVRWQVAPRWNIAAGAEGQWLTGTNVVANEGVSADLSAGYDLHLRGFDYFNIGPAAHYLSYRRNENFYSWGQGGYYSPQQSVSTGLALQWLTLEGRQWQARGSVETGWNTTLQHSQRCFPLGLTPGLVNAILSLPVQSGSNAVSDVSNAFCGGSHDHGPYASAEAAAVAKLSSRVQIGALVTANVTPGRDRQFGAAVFVRYFFEPRAAVFSSDLSNSLQR